MSFIITLLAAVFVFSAVIAIHEFGHFAVAKLCGVQVNEFSIGMGPVLLKKTQNGTQYSLRALPVGVAYAIWSGLGAYSVKPGSCRVEQAAWQMGVVGNADDARDNRPSDHKPVSMVVQW